MSNRTWYLTAGTIGSLVGGYVPTLWGGSDFSVASVFWGVVGGLAGIWLAYKWVNR